MIRAILNGARRLDETLQTRLGRPYNVLLSIGLVTELVQSVRVFPRHAMEARQAAGGIIMILIELALLLHQLGSLSHRFHRRGAHAPARDPAPSPGDEGGREAAQDEGANTQGRHTAARMWRSPDNA